jgi:hypothetical protein
MARPRQLALLLRDRRNRRPWLLKLRNGAAGFLLRPIPVRHAGAILRIAEG